MTGQNGHSATFRMVGTMSGVDHRRKTAGYAPFVGYGMYRYDDWDKRFTWFDVPRMLRDPQITMGMAILESPVQRIDPIVLARNPQVKLFIENTLKRIWQRAIRKIVKPMFEYGHCAGEVEYEITRGRYRFKNLHTVHPIHARALQDRKSREIVGFRVYNIKDDKSGTATLSYPNAFWCAHNNQYGNPYGRSQLMSAREPWMEKSGRHGALEIRRLWFMKNAYSSGILRYPLGTTDLGNGKIIDNQDLAREILEKLETGGVLVLPNTRQGIESDSEYAWDYTPPQIHGGNLAGIVEYPQELDRDILKGMTIPGDILEMDGTRNSWSGRSIPMLMFYSMMDFVITTIIDAISRLIITPLVRINFGPKMDFMISHKSLAEVTYREPDTIQERVIGKDSGGDLGPDPVPQDEGTVNQGMYDDMRNPNSQGLKGEGRKQMPVPREPRPRMARMSIDAVDDTDKYLAEKIAENVEKVSKRDSDRIIQKIAAMNAPPMRVPPEQIVLEPVEAYKPRREETELAYDANGRITRVVKVK